MPKMFAALQASYRWKGLDVSVSFRGAFGFDILNAYRMKYETLAWLSSFNVPKSAYQKIGEYYNFAPSIYSDRYIEPGDYVKLDNLTIGYTFDLSQRNKVIRSIPGLLYGHEPAYDQRLFWAGPRSGDRRPHTRRGPDQQIP